MLNSRLSGSRCVGKEEVKSKVEKGRSFYGAQEEDENNVNIQVTGSCNLLILNCCSSQLLLQKRRYDSIYHYVRSCINLRSEDCDVQVCMSIVVDWQLTLLTSFN